MQLPLTRGLLATGSVNIRAHRMEERLDMIAFNPRAAGGHRKRLHRRVGGKTRVNRAVDFCLKPIQLGVDSRSV